MRKDKSHAVLTLAGPGLVLRGDDGLRGAYLGIDTNGASVMELVSEKPSEGVRMLVREDGKCVYGTNTDIEGCA